MAEIAHERLSHSGGAHAAQLPRRLLELRVAYHAGQDRHGRRARGQEGLQPLRVLCEDRQRRVYIARRELRELGRELFGVHDLEYGGEVVCSGLSAHGQGQTPRAHRGRLRPLGGEAVYELPPRLLKEALRQHQPAPEHNVHPLAGVGRARGAPELGLHRPLTQRLAHGLHRLRPVPDGAVAVLVLDAAAEGPPLLDEGEELHLHPAQLRVRIALAHGVHRALRVPVRRSGQGEHVVLNRAAQIGVRPLPAGEHELQLVLFRRQGLAPVAHAFHAYLRDLCKLLRPLYAPAHDRAGYAEVLKLRDVVQAAQVLETERIVVHPPAEGVALTAEPRAVAPVGAAPAVHGREVALPLPGRAQRAVHRHAQLHTAAPRQGRDVGQGQLRGQHDPRHAQLCRGLQSRRVVYAELRPGEHPHQRRHGPRRGDEAPVLGYDGVHPGLAGAADKVRRRGHLRVRNQRVQLRIHPAAAHAAIAHGPRKFALRESARPCAAEAYTNRVRPALHGGYECLRARCGSQYLEHGLSPVRRRITI